MKKFLFILALFVTEFFVALYGYMTALRWLIESSGMEKGTAAVVFVAFCFAMVLALAYTGRIIKRL